MNYLKNMLCYVFILFCINAPAQSNINGTVLREQSLNTVPCNPNTFWLSYYNSTSNNYSINEYFLTNNFISLSQANISNSPFGSLAYGYSSNVNQYTFYDTDFWGNSQLFVLNGTNWNPISSNLQGFNYCNIAGHNNAIAIQAKDSTFYFKHIIYFNNQTFNSIYYSGNNDNITAADLAIDNNYFIWFFEANDNNFTIPTSLKAIDTLGNIIKNYPLNFNSDFYESYGMFILNNKLYVGVGFNNPIHPNCLIPFSIVNDTVYQETPILLVAPSNRSDLESCNQGTLTSVSEVPESLKELSVYPNPAGNQFTVHLPYGSNRNAQLTIYNLQGELIEIKKASDTTPINCANWARGIYFVSLVEEGKAKVTRKIVVM